MAELRLNAPHEDTALQGVTFPQGYARGFVSEMKRRVHAYFEERQISTKANARMVVKTVIMFLMVAGPYALIMTNELPLFVMWCLCVVMGIGVAGCGFCIAHDALHGAYSSKRWVNAILGMTFDVNGGSSYLWKITHNVIHHTYTNIQGIDEDLEVSPLLRLSPTSEHRSVHRYQHLYVLVAYSMTTLFWVFVKDFQYLLRRDLGPYRNIRHPRGEVVKLLTMKMLYYSYIIVIPLLVLDITWWQFAIGFLTMHLASGLMLSLIFQLSHVVEGPVQFAAANQSMMDDAWFVHEMKTTANFARSNKLLCWYAGGLNFQIEHHLFPKVCSIHYPAICRIVQEVAEQFGIPYHHHPTFLGAIRSHWRTLKRFGDPDALPFSAAT
jgi:linoleoyl-CoA desaturase